MTAPRSIVFDARFRSGLDELLVEVGRKAVAVELEVRASSAPRTPAVIEPPETLETRSSFGR